MKGVKKVVSKDKKFGFRRDYKELPGLLCLLSWPVRKTLTAIGERGTPVIGGYQQWK